MSLSRLVAVDVTVVVLGTPQSIDPVRGLRTVERKCLRC